MLKELNETKQGGNNVYQYSLLNKHGEPYIRFDEYLSQIKSDDKELPKKQEKVNELFCEFLYLNAELSKHNVDHKDMHIQNMKVSTQNSKVARVEVFDFGEADFNNEKDKKLLTTKFLLNQGGWSIPKKYIPHLFRTLLLKMLKYLPIISEKKKLYLYEKLAKNQAGFALMSTLCNSHEEAFPYWDQFCKEIKSAKLYQKIKILESRSLELTQEETMEALSEILSDYYNIFIKYTDQIVANKMCTDEV